MAGDPKDEWTEAVFGIKLDALGGAVAGAGAQPPLAAALKAWDDERAAAATQLRQLGSAIKAANDPEAEDANKLIEEIVENLAPPPDTMQAVDKMEQYLTTDDIIDDAESPNGFGIAITFRGQMLKALGGIRSALGKTA